MHLCFHHLALSAGYLLVVVGYALCSACNRCSLFGNLYHAYKNNAKFFVASCESSLNLLECFPLEPSRNSLSIVREQLLKPGDTILKMTIKTLVMLKRPPPSDYLKRYALYRAIVYGKFKQKEADIILRLVEPLEDEKTVTFINNLVGDIDNSQLASILRRFDRPELEDVWTACLQHCPERLTSIILEDLSGRYGYPFVVGLIPVNVLYGYLLQLENPEECIKYILGQTTTIYQLFALACYSDKPSERIRSFCLEKYPPLNAYLPSRRDGSDGTGTDAETFNPGAVPFGLCAEIFPQDLPKPLRPCCESGGITWKLLKLPISLVDAYIDTWRHDRNSRPAFIAFIDIWKSSQSRILIPTLFEIVSRCFFGRASSSNVSKIVSRGALPWSAFLPTYREVLKFVIGLQQLYHDEIGRSTMSGLLGTCWENYVGELNKEKAPSIEDYLCFYDLLTTSNCDVHFFLYKLEGISTDTYIRMLVEEILERLGDDSKSRRVPLELFDRDCSILAKALVGREKLLTLVVGENNSLYRKLFVNLKLSGEPISADLMKILDPWLPSPVEPDAEGFYENLESYKGSFDAREIDGSARRFTSRTPVLNAILIIMSISNFGNDCPTAAAHEAARMLDYVKSFTSEVLKDMKNSIDRNAALISTQNGISRKIFQIEAIISSDWSLDNTALDAIVGHLNEIVEILNEDILLSLTSRLSAVLREGSLHKCFKARCMISICLNCMKGSKEEHEYLIGRLSHVDHRGFRPLVECIVDYMWENKQHYSLDDFNTVMSILLKASEPILAGEDLDAILNKYFLKFLQIPGARNRIRLCLPS